MPVPEPERLIVLLAEDDERDLVLTRRALQQLGNLDRLIWMPDGEHTITYLQGKAKFSNRKMWPLPTMLVLDESLPRHSGLEVLKWVRGEPQFARLPAVILRGRSPLVRGGRETPGSLHAASCLKGSNARESAEFLAEAFCSALRLAWLVSLPDCAGVSAFASPAPLPPLVPAEAAECSTSAW
jgi:CheY-like chemotaxis protein